MLRVRRTRIFLSRPKGFPLVTREPAQPVQTKGTFFFGYFLLGAQKKVPRLSTEDVGESFY